MRVIVEKVVVKVRAKRETGREKSEKVRIKGKTIRV